MRVHQRLRRPVVVAAATFVALATMGQDCEQSATGPQTARMRLDLVAGATEAGSPQIDHAASRFELVTPSDAIRQIQPRFAQLAEYRTSAADFPPSGSQRWALRCHVTWTYNGRRQSGTGATEMIWDGRNDVLHGCRLDPEYGGSPGSTYQTGPRPVDNWRVVAY